MKSDTSTSQMYQALTSLVIVEEEDTVESNAACPKKNLLKPFESESFQNISN